MSVTHFNHKEKRVIKSVTLNPFIVLVDEMDKVSLIIY